MLYTLFLTSSRAMGSLKAGFSSRAVSMHKEVVGGDFIIHVAFNTYRQTLLTTSDAFLNRVSGLRTQRLVSVKSGVPSMPTQKNVRYCWQRWVALIQTLHALAALKPTFFALASPELRFLASAFSWYTWSGSALTWFVVNNVTPAMVVKPQYLPTNTCLLVLDPIVDTAVQRALLRTPLPTVGCVASGVPTSLLWAGSSFEGGGFEVGFSLLTALWFFISRGA